MKTTVTVDEQISVVAWFPRDKHLAEAYKNIKIQYVFFKNRWIHISQTIRVWKQPAGKFYDYYFKVFNKKDIGFTIVFITWSQTWEMVSYEYDV